jgi:hypothetical protein
MKVKNEQKQNGNFGPRIIVTFINKLPFKLKKNLK